MRATTLRGIAIAAGAIAVAALVLGLVFRNQADFSNTYVRDQLTAQKVIFLPVDDLTSEQKKSQCLVANAGQPLTTGAQAECYANDQIGEDLKLVAGGKTYAEVSYPAKLARDKANEALAKDPGSADTQTLLMTANNMDIPVQVMFRGETLRGLLLTSYGFGLLGERASQAATASFVVFGVVLLAMVVCLLLAAHRGPGRLRGERDNAERIVPTLLATDFSERIK